MRELPSYAQMYRQIEDRGFVFLAVNIQEPHGVVEAWARRAEATFPILLDVDGAVSRDYRVTGTPTVYLVDRKGRFVGWYVGTKDLWSAEGRRLIEALLGEPGPAEGAQ